MICRCFLNKMNSSTFKETCLECRGYTFIYPMLIGLTARKPDQESIYEKHQIC